MNPFVPGPEKADEPFVPFVPSADYDRHVDGRRRRDGTWTVLGGFTPDIVVTDLAELMETQ